MSEYILKTQALTKRYGSFAANDSISLTIRKGAIYGLVGRNGAGKTTFMKMICSLSKPTSGSFELCGEAYPQLRRARTKIGNLIEAPGIYAGLSAYDNLKAKAKLYGTDDRKKIEAILETVGLANTGSKHAGSFSLGMRQRLGIGLALIGEPEVLVLDEPINGLDPTGVAEIRETIKRLNAERGMTVLISSHILSELSKLSTDYGFIDKGCLIKELSEQQLLDDCAEYVRLNVKNATLQNNPTNNWYTPTVYEMKIFGTPVQAADEPKPVAAFDFESAGQGSVPDLTGNGNDLMLSGNVTIGNAQNGKGLTFDGDAASYASLPDGLLDGCRDYTICMDVKSNSTGDFFTFALGQDENKYAFFKVADDHFRFQTTVDTWRGETGMRYDSGNTDWNNYVLSVNGATARLYKNGELVKQTTDLTTMPADMIPACTAVMPMLRAVMPSAKETAKYPMQIGKPSRRPFKNHEPRLRAAGGVPPSIFTSEILLELFIFTYFMIQCCSVAT